MIESAGTTATTSLADIFEARQFDRDEVVLDVGELGVRFGGVVALAGVSFSVRRHELVAVIGPNGSGKSTLLNSISSLILGNTSGEILLNGKPILGRRPVSIARAGVGRSFQNPSLIDSGTVLDNVMLGEHLRLRYSMFDQLARRRRVRRLEEQARQRAMVALEFMNLARLANRGVAGLAYGTRKLVDIARAIVAGPELLLLDEPTSGLDSEEQSAVGQMLRELHRGTQVTIIVVEHHMHVVHQVADRVVALESGNVVTIGRPDEVLASESFRVALASTPEARALGDLSTVAASTPLGSAAEGGDD